MSNSKRTKREQLGLGDPLFGTRLGEVRKKPEYTAGADLFIVDNSDSDWKVMRYLHEWADIAHSFDIATGFFEIGALLALDGQWQKLNNLRILMGDTTSKRTKTLYLKASIRFSTPALKRRRRLTIFSTECLP